MGKKDKAPLCVEIGKRLREERTRLGLTQEEFAAAGDVSLSSQVAQENGFRVPDLNYAAAISKVGADVVYI